ncbi:hypothetical protein F4775DRAFT_607349 [Biscogniauxia sp. FL1348]|nr:hypothetical protein F4775DRAFT_607349 [Biscogniauxia sp. FL1348]
MCISLYIHNTSLRHDTRFLSVLNPVTGYTVYSPFQDPCVKPSPCECPIPHTQPGHPHPDIPAPHEVCLWHAPCCRLEIIKICHRTNNRHVAGDDRASCQTWTKYHHFCETPQGRNDRGFLREYFLLSRPHDDAFLPFVAHFFKAGVELALANRYHAQAARRLRDADVLLGLPVPEKQALMQQAVYFDRVSRCAVEVLAQFALLWDARSAGAGWPARPGRARYPALNAATDKLTLRPANWARDDVAPVAWPGGETPWESLEGMLSFPGDDPAAVAWCYNPDGSAPVGHMGWGERFKGEMLDPALLAGAGNDVPKVLAGTEMFTGADDFALDPEFDFDFNFDFNLGVGLGITAPAAQWDWGLDEGMQNVGMGEGMDIDMAMDVDIDIPPVSWDAVAVESDLAATREVEEEEDISSSLSLSSPSSSTPSLLSVSSSEDESEQSDESDDNEEEEEYPVERLVDHRPKRGPRAGVKYYRVRWQGNWPAHEKETWQRRGDIAPQLIREYWQTFDSERARVGKKKTVGARASWGAKHTRQGR